MGTVLISLEGGAGVVRQRDGMTLVTVRIEPIAAPAARLLGPQPPDPDAG